MNSLNNTHPSILIVKTSAIGDVVQTFPVLEYLRGKFPDAKIDWVVEEGIAPLLCAHPLLNEVISIRSKAWTRSLLSPQTRTEFSAFVKRLRSTHYDYLFDLQGNTKSSVPTGLARAKTKAGFGWSSVREKPNLLVTGERFNFPASLSIRLKYLGLVQSFLQDPEPFMSKGVRLRLTEEEKARLGRTMAEPALSKRPRWMVCFGSRWANKRMKASTMLSFLERVRDHCDPSFLFIYSNEEERRAAEKFKAHFTASSLTVGELTLPLWQALMWEMDGVIAVDSAALHLCGTTETPSFSVFGPSLASYYKPTEERHAAVQGSCPYGMTFPARCPKLRTCPTGACIRQLTADELFAAFRQHSTKGFGLLQRSYK